MSRTEIGSGRTGSCLPLVIVHSQRFEKAHVHILEILGIGIFIPYAAEKTIGTCCGFLS
jgi:hypothetical protein